MSKKKQIIKLSRILVLGGGAMFICLSLAALLTFYIVSYYHHIYPNVSVGGFDVSGLTREEAVLKVQTNAYTPNQLTLIIQSATEKQEIALPQDVISLRVNSQSAVDAAYKIGRSGNFIIDVIEIIGQLNKHRDVSITYTFDESQFIEYLTSQTLQVVSEPVDPRLGIEGNAVIFYPGSKGEEIPKEYAIEQLNRALAGKQDTVLLSTKVIDPGLSAAEEEIFKSRGQVIANNNLKLSVKLKDTVKKELLAKDLIPLLSPRGGYNQAATKALVETLRALLEREPQNPIFRFEHNRVVEFAPAIEGITLDTKSFENDLLLAVSAIEQAGTSQEVNVQVTTKKPDRATEDVNNLGIKELIGEGFSSFRGSIPSRVHNVSLASSKINGVLIAPGQVFSFNDALGDISKFTGYKEAYVIQDGKTVLGDGGGVCQVSTTLFRAVLNAGLPVTERRGHSYRVGYYEQGAAVGLDATVYSPTTDFKFKNDTGAHILLQTTVDTKNMTAHFQLFGTRDGRVSTITKPVLTGVTPPPDDLYIDDPTLPNGQIKQIEHKAWGGKATFRYKVTRDGATLYEKTFDTSYKPWQAVYLRGTRV